MATPAGASFVGSMAMDASSFASFLATQPSSFAGTQQHYQRPDGGFFDFHDNFSPACVTKPRERNLSLVSLGQDTNATRTRGESIASNGEEVGNAFARFKGNCRSIGVDEDPPPASQPVVRRLSTASVMSPHPFKNNNTSTPTTFHDQNVASPATTAASPIYSASFVLVVDPLSRKIAVPRHAIKDTLATSRPGVPSLCLLYLSSKCRQGAQCRQIHADHAVIAKLREEAKKLPTCCQVHGDMHSNLFNPEWHSYTIEVKGVQIPGSKLAYTSALAKLLADNTSNKQHFVVAPQALCRLHGAERCRFTDDCRFIHVCRDVLQEQFRGVVEDLVPELEIKHSSATPPEVSRIGATTNHAVNSPVTQHLVYPSSPPPPPRFAPLPTMTAMGQPTPFGIQTQPFPLNQAASWMPSNDAFYMNTPIPPAVADRSASSTAPGPYVLVPVEQYNALVNHAQRPQQFIMLPQVTTTGQSVQGFLPQQESP